MATSSNNIKGNKMHFVHSYRHIKNVLHIFFQIHLASCNFLLISCSNENCEMKVSRKDLEEHATKKCQWRTVHCDHCHELYPECQMEVSNHILQSYVTLGQI